jgi:hypothetical protein
MEYLIKLDGPRAGMEFYIKMPGTVTDEEVNKRIEEAEKKYMKVRYGGSGEVKI